MTDIANLKVGDRIVVDTHRRQGERYERGVITGLSSPGWVYYRPDGNGRVVAEDPSNVKLEDRR